LQFRREREFFTRARESQAFRQKASRIFEQQKAGLLSAGDALKQLASLRHSTALPYLAEIFRLHKDTVDASLRKFLLSQVKEIKDAFPERYLKEALLKEMSQQTD